MGVRIGKRHDPSLLGDTDGAWWLIWDATRIAPLKVEVRDDGSVFIRAKDPDHARPGPDERQRFAR